MMVLTSWGLAERYFQGFARLQFSKSIFFKQTKCKALEIRDSDTVTGFKIAPKNPQFDANHTLNGGGCKYL